jgi:hypothetical protein
LFIVTLFAHLLLAAYALYRMTQRVAVSDVTKTGFVGMAQARLSTPESGAMDPRVDKPEARDEFDDAPMGK